MSMGPNKFGSILRKRQESSDFVNNPFDVSVLSMEVDSHALFRRDALPLIPGRKKEGLDEVLVALLSEANQELAHLLRDVRTESQGVLLGGHQIRPVNELLMRAVRCAAQQYMLQAELGNLALTDELTGLYNRRGFMALAERQLKVGRRSGREMLLFFIDLDGLKQINDSFGHSEGDRALKRTAQALEMAFRDSDVIARVAGDEFAILAIEAAGDSEATIRNRLCEDLKSISAEESRYTISLSLGAARFDPRSSTSLGELMVQADRAMYEVKRGRSKPSAIPENGYRTQ
jgi:diguanylate cyclase (GGDEF)-like protein